ncbi:spore coat protein [Caproiciproducens galactitolivorans]|uniref:Spore coat protein n=1 Tax=Caproiciproducens galactitolivorans TaxID=642589 RepID=A0ABT4BSA6_9FIRM|nr:spore coat protein [Caproiciproducens galactitolivorans]MCY1713781.1 spore coat protein [Caproiciproducens galactitolivorans]
MTLTQKETTLLQDLKSQEQLCIDKYSKYSSDACGSKLKDLFSEIKQTEQQHFTTVNQILGGTVPQVGGGSQANSAQSDYNSQYSEQDKQKDKFLCTDALSTEKHVSSLYNTCIFECKDTNVRNVLNHIQKEEQQHGEKIYNFMSQNGMYS